MEAAKTGPSLAVCSMVGILFQTVASLSTFSFVVCFALQVSELFAGNTLYLFIPRDVIG